MRPRLATRRHIAMTLALFAGLGCAQDPVSVPLRSLERSGAISVLCLGPVGEAAPGRPTSTCLNLLTNNPTVAHNYALATQPNRGEIAVIDLTANAVVDQDPTAPGFNFLPVGERPEDIASTPGGTASFVASADPTRPGLYALPSTDIRGSRAGLTSWPACALPSIPGKISVVVGPAASATCASPNFAVDTLGDQGNTKRPNGDLAAEVSPPGTRKLLVTQPATGHLLVIDAQRLLDRPRGSFDPCPIERKLALKVELPPGGQTPAENPVDASCPPPAKQASDASCPVRETKFATFPSVFTPQPAEMTQDEKGVVYVSDRGAPAIHRYDFANPCEPRELPPLWPTSDAEPNRPVFTKALAVSPETSDAKRFVYAVDAEQGSVMVFDVSSGSQQRTPVKRPHPEYFPFSPEDRLAIASPVKALSFVTRDIPFTSESGVELSGIQCDPNPALAAEDPAASYRTASDYRSGASPGRLRGIFAAALTTSGQMMLIDVDDLDAKCRSYRRPAADAATTPLPSWVTGCETCTDGSCMMCSAEPPAADVGTSAEATCRAVVRHELRSSGYFATNAELGPQAPTFQTYPVLQFEGNTLKSNNSPDGIQNPKLLGPISGFTTETSDGSSTSAWEFARGATTLPADADPKKAERNFVVTDNREPRLHVNQDWEIRYEAVIPGSSEKVANLLFSVANPDERGAYDPSGNFCGLGVLDRDAARLVGARVLADELAALNNGAGPDDATRQALLDSFASTHADLLEITNPLFDSDDPYWRTTGDQCTYNSCRATFGRVNSPTANRFFGVRKALQDRLLIDEKTIYDVTDPTPQPNKRTIATECCFPTLSTYRIRAQQTWIAQGSAVGFLHHMIVGNDGQCIEAGVDRATGAICDERLQTRSSRVYELPFPCLETDDAGVCIRPDEEKRVPLERTAAKMFHNTNFYFAIFAGATPSVRDMAFRYRMIGGFATYQISLANGSFSVSPQSMTFNPVSETFLVADGASQGVSVVDIGASRPVRSYFLSTWLPRAPNGCKGIPTWQRSVK